MTCPHCGSALPASVSRCPACQRGLPDGHLVAAGLLTPLPAPPSGDDETRAGTEPTMFVVPSAAIDTPTILPPDWSDADPGGETRQPGAYLPAITSAAGDSGPLALGQAFGTRYRILRLLGIGGMGAVYQAWDAELGMAVALKVIRPEATADPAAAREMERRFKQELVLARQVTHKNVVRIHDLGSIEGIKYITMPYLEGADLSSVIEKSGTLPVPMALRIVRHVAAGLVAAHDAGIVHRDLKPANIMVLDEHAVIMDFGIARLSSRVAAPSAADVKAGRTPSLPAGGGTMHGAIVGTPQYMAPEQARGEGVDQRADVYALGLILSDMLLGKRDSATIGESSIAELKRRMEHAPAPVRSADSSIPEAVERLISRCLEPDPARRFQTSAALVAELNTLDEHGNPLPIRRVVGMRILAAVVTLGVALLGGSWWYARTLIPPRQPDPVTVVIADIQNNTSDPSLDRALEPTLRRALEDAGFVSAYDRSRIIGSLGVQPPEKLDENAARALAANQGLGVVVSGSIDRRGTGYEMAVKAVQAVTGEVIASDRSRASSKDQVLEMVTRLVNTVRTALGDETSDSAQMFAMRSVSATSLDVVHHYAAAVEAQSNGKLEDARQSALKAIELDPKFGIGYQLLAVASRNLGNLQDAEKYSNQALTYLEGMTERERYATRGLSYRLTGDYQQCVKEYGDMTARYAADAIAHNQRALCLSKLRNMREAVEAMHLAVKILPKRITLRGNLALYAAYGSDFQTAAAEAGEIQEPYDLATLVVAFAHLGQGQLQPATETYQKLAAVSPRGASWAASGLADLALYQGRFSDAARLFEQGAAADLASKTPDRAARKLTSLAYAHLLMGRRGPAVAAADKALLTSNNTAVRFLAARIFVEAGEVAKARTLAEGLASELPAEPQAYGKIIEGEIALREDPRQAIRILNDANAILDTWIGHFDLGRAYLEVGGFAQADSEFDRCIGRRGEALSLLVDEEPTYGYFPPAYYYQGRVREGLKSERFAESYRAYLDIRGQSKEDSILPDVRRRAGP